MISRSTLTKVAIVGGAVTASAGIYFKNYQTQIRNTKTYKKALEKVYNHEQTVKLLGQPIKEGRITFKDNNDNSKQFSVNLRGSNNKAKLNCEFIINELDRKTELTKLEVKFDNLPNKVFVIHET